MAGDPLHTLRGGPSLRVLQFVSSSLLSLAHNGNDAQKTMGIITVLSIRKDG